MRQKSVINTAGPSAEGRSWGGGDLSLVVPKDKPVEAVDDVHCPTDRFPGSRPAFSRSSAAICRGFAANSWGVSSGQE